MEDFPLEVLDYIFAFIQIDILAMIAPRMCVNWREAFNEGYHWKVRSSHKVEYNKDGIYPWWYNKITKVSADGSNIIHLLKKFNSFRHLELKIDIDKDINFLKELKELEFLHYVELHIYTDRPPGIDAYEYADLDGYYTKINFINIINDLKMSNYIKYFKLYVDNDVINISNFRDTLKSKPSGSFKSFELHIKMNTIGVVEFKMI